MVFVSSSRFSVVLSGCRMVSVVVYCCHGLVASQWFSVVLTGSRRFSVVLVSSQCSRRFSMVLCGSRRFAMFLCAFCWLS